MKGFTRISIESYQVDQGDSTRHNKEVEIFLIRDYIVDLEHNLIYRNDNCVINATQGCFSSVNT